MQYKKLNEKQLKKNNIYFWQMQQAASKLISDRTPSRFEKKAKWLEEPASFEEKLFIYRSTNMHMD